MTEAETLHKRKMQLKNDIVKPLLNLIDRGLDVPGILQNLTREGGAGKGLDGNKWGESGERKKK